MSYRLAATLASSLALVFCASAPAQAADPGFCRDYARTAIHQVHQAGERCPYLLSRGARWQEDYGGHFNWCLGVRRDQADSERDARWRALQDCRR